MSRDRAWWLLLPRPIRRLPADLAATIGLTIVTVLVVLVPGVRETPVRVLLGLPFVLFLPGYAFVAALFPEAGHGPADESVDDSVDSEAAGLNGGSGSADPSAEPTDPTSGGRGIDGIERVALSFGLSIAIVPLIGLVLNFTPWGIRLGPILLSVSGFTIGAAAVGAVRRWELPAEERFRVPYERWLGSARSELFEPDSRTDALLNVLLVASVLLATASVAYAVAVPKQGEAFTEFYYLSETEDGELVAAEYPTEYTLGESRPVVIGIGNHEHRPMNYTFVAKLQRVRIANNSTTVLESTELDRRRIDLAANETRHFGYNIEPTMTGTRLRVLFLLYTEPPGSSPSIESAYRETHLFINVSEPG